MLRDYEENDPFCVRALQRARLRGVLHAHPWQEYKTYEYFWQFLYLEWCRATNMIHRELEQQD